MSAIYGDNPQLAASFERELEVMFDRLTWVDEVADLTLSEIQKAPHAKFAFNVNAEGILYPTGHNAEAKAVLEILKAETQGDARIYVAAFERMLDKSLDDYFQQHRIKTAENMYTLTIGPRSPQAQ